MYINKINYFIKILVFNTKTLSFVTALEDVFRDDYGKISLNLDSNPIVVGYCSNNNKSQIKLVKCI